MIKSIRDQIYHRQLGILSPSKIDKEIGLIGVGAVGSSVALMLVKIGFPKITAWDPDRVEEHNLPNQMFRRDAIGNYKTNALFWFIEEFMFPEQCQDFQDIEKKWDGTIKDILISAVDSMDERKKIWKRIKNSKCEFYIDCRMGGELLRIYTIRPQRILDKEFYEEHFYSSKEADSVPCTERAILYNCFSIAGLVGSQLKKIINKEDFPREIIFDLKNLEFIKTN